MPAGPAKMSPNGGEGPAGAALVANAASPASGVQMLDYRGFQTQVQPFLNQYCVQCHSAAGTDPDIRFDAFSSQASLQGGIPILDRAVKMLSGQRMPPKSKPQPSLEERQRVVEWLQAYSSQIDCSNPETRTPGRVTLHRLNRAEYNNTVRDLLALDIQPANMFPSDDAGYGFDNNGDVLSIAPVLMEKYIAAAELTIDRALFSDPVVPPPYKRFEAATLEGSIPKSDPEASTPARGPGGRTMSYGRVFNYAGEIETEYDFPADGQYLLHARGYGKQKPMVQFKIDGEDAGTSIAITEDIGNTKVYATGKVKVAAGRHRVTLAFVNGPTKQAYNAFAAAAALAAAKAASEPPVETAAAAPAAPRNIDDVDPATVQEAVARGAARKPPAQPGPQAEEQQADVDPATAAPPPARGRNGGANGGGRGGARRGGANGARGGRGGPAAVASAGPSLGVVFIQIEGPLDPTPDRMPESYRRVMVAHPSATLSRAQAAEQIIRNFASKAYRRPASDDDVKPLMAIWSKYDSPDSPFEAGISPALEAVLVSPQFLFRYEREPGPDDPNGIRTLDEYELASRLSYFLWSSMPDDELFNLAREGKLRANFEAQVQRMLKDPKASALVDNFAGQWLKLRMMDTVAPDAATFPEFDDSLRLAMIAETQMLFTNIMQEDRSVLDFIDADYTFLNERLAKFYGIDGVAGPEFRRVKLATPDRGGLLTQASILTLTSYPARTSPVQRGKWVLENLLDQAPPPPPPGVPALQDEGQLKGTLRQRMEQHRANPACAACHEQMDAIGFGLENFNAIGQWRTVDAGATIDPAGSLPGGQKFSGPAQLKQIIKLHQDDFLKTLAGKLMNYALGRGLEKPDKCTIDEIVGKMKQNGMKFSVLVDQIVLSDPFQKRAAK